MNRYKKKVAIVGTNGIPAQYGGYETLAEYLTQNLSENYQFTVYCSKNQPRLLGDYNRSKLKYVPLRANGWQSLLYDAYSLFHAAHTSDVILYLGPGSGFLIPIIKLFKKKIIVNHGGLNEWEREKYSLFQRFIAKMGHKYAAKYATFNIADNSFLQMSLKNEFDVNSHIIRYGGDHAVKENMDEELLRKYPFLDSKYFVNVSRAQVDNNLHLVLSAFKDTPEHCLVMISNWTISNYGIDLKKEYGGRYKNIILLDAIYEPKEINAIRGNANVYIHSHSYCGTSPSLLEAMALGLPVFSFDVPTNRETTMKKALYFKDVSTLIHLIQSTTETDLNLCRIEMGNIAKAEYTWLLISSQYAKMFDS